MDEIDKTADAITTIAKALTKRYGRMPTDEEVERFILGDEEERFQIWNFGLPKKEQQSD